MSKTMNLVVRAIAFLLAISSAHGLEISISSRVDKETGLQNRVRYFWPSGEFLHKMRLEENGRVLQHFGLEIPALSVGSITPAGLLEEINRTTGFGLFTASSFQKSPLAINSSFTGHEVVGISLGLFPGHFSLFAFDREISRHAGALSGGSLTRLGAWEAVTLVSQLSPAPEKEDWISPVLPMISSILGHSAFRMALEINHFSFFLFGAVSGGKLQRPDVRAAVTIDIHLIDFEVTSSIAYSGPDYVALYGRRPTEAFKVSSEMQLGPIEWRDKLQVEIEGIHELAVHHLAVYPGVCRESRERVCMQILLDFGYLQFDFDWEFKVSWSDFAELHTKHTMQGGASYRTDATKMQFVVEGIRDISGYGLSEPLWRGRMDLRAGVEGNRIGIAGSIGIIKDESYSLRYGFDVDVNAESGSVFCRIGLDHPMGSRIGHDGWDISLGWHYKIALIEPIHGMHY
jgi:hypothetical protein